MKLNRRQFVQTTAVAGAGLVIAFRFPEALSNTEPAVFGPNAYIRISSDNVVTLSITRSEMGQGVRTNLPATLAEELEVELSTVKLDQAMPGARFKGIRLRTSGSGSSSGTFMALRRAGATAREMLISAAAQQWNIDRASCRAELGFVIDKSGRKLSYGRLAETAAKLPVPENPPLKSAKDFRLIGKPLKRIDGPAIVRGQATYGIDIRVPGMLFAVMARSPYLGGKVTSFDSRKALAVDGVRHVVPIQTGISTGVAVVADTTWTAMKGREALEVKWDKGSNSEFDSEQFLTKLQSAFSEGGFPIRREGDAAAALRNAASRIDAVYEYPFQAHAPMETMNCTADVRSNSCEVWVPTQTPETAHADIMKTLNLRSESVKLHTTMLGGGFGRRLFSDYVHEAVELSKAIGKPVQLVWSRNDDMRNGFFHPASVEQLSAGFDEGKRVTAWLHKSAGSDLSMFGPPTEEEKKDVDRYAKDGSPWGAYDNPYTFSSMKVDYVPVNSPVPTGPWRAVEYPARVFARESFVDEIAHVAGQDPLQFRIGLLQPGGILALGPMKLDRTRMIRVLELLREKSGWTKPFAVSDKRLWGRGVALNIYHAGSYVAQVAEVSVARDFSDFRVHRICCAVDCGFVINPAGLEGQVESGITWGLSATLHGKIDFRGGRAQQGTYEDFRVMRMNDMPNIETYLVPSTDRPEGFGEHPVPPVAPAVANALYAATGKRMRSLPITPEKLRNASISK
jgi:isoquinoline 1-oxidoreductase beta subunit